MKVVPVILAAGKGKRMRSKHQKVLHPLCGKPIIQYVLDAARKVTLSRAVVVTGPSQEEFRRTLCDSCDYAVQREPKGSGDALKAVAGSLKGFKGTLLVLSGDVPGITPATLRRLLRTHEKSGSDATVLTANIDDPSGYGRIIRDASGRVTLIKEDRDLRASEKNITEINTGIYCFKSPGIFDVLGRIKTNNRQGEYYITDSIGIIHSSGGRAECCVIQDYTECEGVNDRSQLAYHELKIFAAKNTRLMKNGVRIIDPASCYIEPRVRVGRDTVILPGSFLKGGTVIGEDCEIGPGTVVENSVLGNSVKASYSVILDSKIDDGVKIGPYAHLRPETVIRAGAKVGNFVEIKKSVVGKGSKVPHLSYIGDASLGEKVNIGAGTITANYDGKSKSRTVIRDNVFIGSGTTLVAPVTIGKGAVTGAGSVVTKNRNVPPNAVVVGVPAKFVKFKEDNKE